LAFFEWLVFLQMASNVWQQRLKRFHAIANPERDILGLRVKPTPENEEARKYYAKSSAETKNFVYRMVEKLHRCESKHPNHERSFTSVQNIFKKIPTRTIVKYAEAISALLVRLGSQLESEWYTAHPNSRTRGPSFRWSFRHMMMERCKSEKLCKSRQIEHWMQYQELLLPAYAGTPEMEALRAYK